MSHKSIALIAIRLCQTREPRSIWSRSLDYYCVGGTNGDCLFTPGLLNSPSSLSSPDVMHPLSRLCLSFIPSCISVAPRILVPKS
ncbi:Uncharacterized protein HZ326_18481 [Fusarium oxysporum f. sp. albedinis]|nr:Uncharacterized protein HZ326_18481 [Fusarium oxysporum f. sp. albedinis]